MLIQAPDGIVALDCEATFYVKVANTSNKRVRICAGEIIGKLLDAQEHLSREDDLDIKQKRALDLKVQAVTALLKQNSKLPEKELEETEFFRGPKTAQPGPDKIYPSKDLWEIIDVDPALPEEQRNTLYDVVGRNQQAFGFDGRLGHLRTKVHIELQPGTKPISMPPYQASPAKREIIDKQIDLWLVQEVIEESKSPWGAPVIIVLRNGKPQLCIDWRRLNAATIVDQHPIPKQTDILQALSGSQYLSVFDTLSGFTQMEFDEESRPISAIQTHRGLHQFCQMPFGWQNGPPKFQHAMQDILAPYLWIFALVYIDNIVVYSRTFEEHLQHMGCVLSVITKSGLTLLPPKCHLGYRSIVVLGNKVSRLGLSTHAEKLKAMWKLEAPKTRKLLETFVGLAVYFAAYIPFFSWIATPLFKLMRNKEDALDWTAKH
jgi:hypothetical protein